MLSVKIENFLYKSCLFHVLLTQRPFGISHKICTYVYTISNFDQIAVEVHVTVLDIDAIHWDNACCGPNGTSAGPRSLASINSLWLVKHEMVIPSCQSIANWLKSSHNDAFVTSAHYRV